VPTDAELITRLDLVTDKLSTQVRTLALGLLAFAGGLLVTSAIKSNGEGLQLPRWFQWHLFGVGVLVLLTLLFDILQYVCAYKSGKETRAELQRKIQESRKGNPSSDADSVEVGYDVDSCWYRGITFFFDWKIRVLILATAWLIIVSAVFLCHKKSNRRTQLPTVKEMGETHASPMYYYAVYLLTPRQAEPAQPCKAEPALRCRALPGYAGPRQVTPRHALSWPVALGQLNSS
jgi:hypothetical protein